MMGWTEGPVRTPAIHVALSSIERSILGLVAFDPDALPAIRAGQRPDTPDADDSGVLRHAVPLDVWPDGLWRALADTIVGLGDPAASQADLTTLYAARTIPDPADRSLLVSLTPGELMAGLRAAWPDAEARRNRIGARIRCLEALLWSHDPIALLPRDALSDEGWMAAGAAISDRDQRDCWSPALRIARRSTLEDAAARKRRAAMRLFELRASLHLTREFGAGFDGYRDDLTTVLIADPDALAILAADEAAGNALAIVREKLDATVPRWRPAVAGASTVTSARLAA